MMLNELNLLMKACITEPGDAIHRQALGDYLAEEEMQEAQAVRLLTIPEGRWMIKELLGDFFVYVVHRYWLSVHNIEWRQAETQTEWYKINNPFVGLLVDIGSDASMTVWTHQARCKTCRICRSRFTRSRGMLAHLDSVALANSMTDNGIQALSAHTDESLGLGNGFLHYGEPHWLWVCDGCVNASDVMKRGVPTNWPSVAAPTKC